MPISALRPILRTDTSLNPLKKGSSMRRIFAVMACWVGLVSGAAAADVGVSIQFAQPGVFGRLDIGQFPEPPQVIVPQPVIIAPPRAMPPPEPVYLWVPMEHRRHWDRYCADYHACGHPVYFVNHVWYRDHVLAGRARGEGWHGDQGEREHGNGRYEHHEHEHEHEHEHDRGHERN
jgi:hypothetical protein